MGPRRVRWILGTFRGTYRVYSRYIRIPGLRAHASCHGCNLRRVGCQDFGDNCSVFNVLEIMWPSVLRVSTKETMILTIRPVSQIWEVLGEGFQELGLSWKALGTQIHGQLYPKVVLKRLKVDYNSGLLVVKVAFSV